MLARVTSLELRIGDVITGPLGEEWGTIREIGPHYVKAERTAHNIWIMPIARLRRNQYGELRYLTGREQ